jgi:DNA-binding transcriptional ArsR family regulator
VAQKKKKEAAAGAKKSVEIIDPKLAKALANSLRVEILAVLSHRQISPVQFTREYGGRLSKVSYHFKVLEGYGCIELVEKVPRRGAVEHVYRSAKRPLLGDADWTKLPKSIQAGITGAILHDFLGRATAAIEAGTFDARDDRHFTWSPVLVDEKGWGELMEILKTALAQVTEVEERSSERLAKSGEKGISTTIALAGFESPPEGG